MPLQLFDEYEPYYAYNEIDNTIAAGAAVVVADNIRRKRIDAVLFTSTDTVDHDLRVTMNGANLGTLKVPAGAGTGTIPAVELFKEMLTQWGIDHITLPQGQALNVSPVVAITGAGVIWFTTFGGYV